MYNSMAALPFIPYNILTYLAQNEEILWKLLAYDTYDALSKPDLTFDEKMALVWKDGPQSEASIFFTNIIDDAIPEAKCVLKIYNYYDHAVQLYNAVAVYAFDFLYPPKAPMVDMNGRPVNRAELFIHRILATLNGAEVGGVGKLTFYDDQSRYDLARSVIGNSKTFTGMQVFLSVMVGDGGESEGCDA